MVENENQIIATLSVAFKRMFPDIADKVETPEVKSWLANSLIGIVEYTGFLPQETRKQRDGRMECHKVYNGDFKELASKLRNTYPNTRDLSAQDLILKVYNGISSIYDVLSVEPNGNPTTEEDSIDSTSIALDSNKSGNTNSAQPSSVSPMVESETKVVETESNHTGTEEPKQEEPAIREDVVEPKVENNDSRTVSEVDGTLPIAEKNSEENVSTEQTQYVEEETRGTRNKENDMEDNQMSQVEELLAKANAAAEQMGGSEEITGAPVSNVSDGKERLNAAKVEVSEALKGSLESRKQWTQSNLVEAIIITKQPAAKRVIKPMGKVPFPATGKNATTADAKVATLMANFIKACYGRALSEDDWKQLDEQARYAQVIKADKKLKEGKASNLAKAKLVYGILTEMKNTPEGEFAAFVNDKNISYSWKGIMLNGKPLNREDLVCTLIDNSTGVAIGAGSNIADIEKRVEFKLGQTSAKAKAKTTGITGSGHQASKKLVVSIKNKPAFTADESHIRCMMTQPSENADAKASFPVAIKPEGFDSCAGSFSYVRTNDAFEDEYRPNKDKEGNAVYKTGVFTLRVSVPVTDVKKVLDAEFAKVADTARAVDLYWGIKLAPTKQADAASPTALEGTILETALAQYFVGEVSGAADSAIVKSLDQIRKAAQAEADAEEAAQLDQ